jgi:hypothetical protein
MAFVPGCASDTHPNDVPGTASLTSEGTNRIVYTAPTAGTVYVYDDSTNRMIYSGTMMPGQRVIVHPKNDRIDLDDHKVSDQTLHTGNSYQIYFDRHAPAVVEHKVVEERRIETHD